jgi:hypothetical protein
MVRRFLGKKKNMIKNKDIVTAKPKDDPTCLGKVMVRLHLLTDEQLDKIMRYEPDSDLRIGELACNLGYCQPVDIERAQHVQSDMRGGNGGMAAMSFLVASTERMAEVTKAVTQAAKRKGFASRVPAGVKKA